MMKLQKKIKLRIKKEDNVVVIAGNDKGKKGRVISVDVKKRRAVVEGVNVRTFHKKPTQQKPKGQREKREASVHVSNLMLLDPETQAPTRVGKKTDSEGKRKRYAKKTENFI